MPDYLIAYEYLYDSTARSPLLLLLLLNFVCTCSGGAVYDRTPSVPHTHTHTHRIRFYNGFIVYIADLFSSWMDGWMDDDSFTFSTAQATAGRGIQK